MTRTIEQIVADVARVRLDPFGPRRVPCYVQAARELADQHGYTVRQIDRLLHIGEPTVLRYLNEEHDWRRGGL